jgi:LCP family protein required for cell wall assembly
MMVLMVLGIDQTGPVQASDSYNNHGASDMVALLIFDEASQTCRVLTLNRDTMLEMPVLGVGGKNAGTYYGQLALSHTYGIGMADSCENTRRTISNFLYGIRIDYYLAMNMDAISILNDAVGGVTVNVTDDFSHVDPTITKGQMTLRGEQAIRFVRTRRDVGDQLNISRIDRQKEYIGSFLKKFRSRYHSDLEFAATTYDQVLPYIVTDCSLNTITSLMDRYGDYEIREVVSPAGENVMGEEYYEFYADEDALDELILRLFYAPKE